MGEAGPSTAGKELQQQQSRKEEGKEDKEECAWCKYMKAGGCREPFEAWQACVDSVMGADMDAGARKDAVDKCSGVTQPLFECMMRHRDYYGPQLSGMGADSEGPSGSGAGSGGSSSSSGGTHAGSAAAAGGGGAPAGGRVSVSVAPPGAGGVPAAAPS